MGCVLDKESTFILCHTITFMIVVFFICIFFVGVFCIWICSNAYLQNICKKERSTCVTDWWKYIFSTHMFYSFCHCFVFEGEALRFQCKICWMGIHLRCNQRNDEKISSSEEKKNWFFLRSTSERLINNRWILTSATTELYYVGVYLKYVFGISSGIFCGVWNVLWDDTMS
jgi:hypothetical protein